jgi:glycosyltransferase involved in cell wall biosynthesis
MRVGIDGHMIGDHSGGNESYYTNILLNMQADKNMQLFLFLKQGVDDSKYKDKFIIVRFKSSNSFVRNFVELPMLCKKYKLDLLHTQYFIPFYRPCPVVCTIHDICFEHYKNIFTKKEYIRQKLLIPYAARHSKVIYTVSENARQDIVNHYQVSQERVLVTYNAVNADFKKLDNDELNEIELREKFEIGEARYILSVGNLQPRKNLPRLIKAFLLYTAEMKTDDKLVIVGKKAWMYDEILREAENNTDKIIFTDYVTNEELIRLYNLATCFVYPSFFEGFGIPPLEAMACGTPVAVADATSLPEVVGDAGIYFDPFDEISIKDAIVALMSDELCRTQLIDKGNLQKEKFKWADSSLKIIESYKKAGKNK